MTNKDKIQITFLGTGTSSGVPLLTCQCKVCKSTNVKDKRLRSSIFVVYKGKQILIDIGPDFRQQMLRENIQTIDSVLITHSHHDHVAGLDELRAYNFSSQKDMDVYANATTIQELKIHFDYIFKINKYPGIASVALHELSKEKFNVQGIEISPIEVWHHKLPVSAFRIADFAYVTDIKSIKDEEFEKLKGVKILILSALRYKPHLAHFNYEEALVFVAKLAPEKTYFTHISHQFGFHESIEKILPDSISVAYDGLKILV